MSALYCIRCFFWADTPHPHVRYFKLLRFDKRRWHEVTEEIDNLSLFTNLPPGFALHLLGRHAGLPIRCWRYFTPPSLRSACATSSMNRGGLKSLYFTLKLKIQSRIWVISAPLCERGAVT